MPTEQPSPGTLLCRSVSMFTRSSSPTMPSRLRRSCTRLSRRKTSQQDQSSAGSFLNATPEEVLEVLKSIIGEVVEYTAEPGAWQKLIADSIPPDTCPPGSAARRARCPGRRSSSAARRKVALTCDDTPRQSATRDDHHRMPALLSSSVHLQRNDRTPRVPTSCIHTRQHLLPVPTVRRHPQRTAVESVLL